MALTPPQRKFLRVCVDTDIEADRRAAYRESGCAFANASEAAVTRAMRELLERADALGFMQSERERREIELLAEDKELAGERLSIERLKRAVERGYLEGLLTRLSDSTVTPAAYAALTREAKQVVGTGAVAGMSQDAALAAMHRLQEIEAAKGPPSAQVTPMLPPKQGEDIARA